jgi:hypothetical protein
LRSLAEQSWKYGIRVLLDEKRKNRMIMLSPRLEEWMVQTVKDAALKLTDFGFDSGNGVRLHAEINERLGSLERLVEALIAAKSPRLLRLQALLKQG